MKNLRMLKVVVMAMSLSYGSLVQADTQVVYFPTNVEGVEYLSNSVKDFIVNLIKYRCPYAYETAEKIIVTDVAVTDEMLAGFDLFSNMEVFVAANFDVKYKKELKLDNDNIRMTLAETFIPFLDESEDVSLISLDSSGAICR